MSKKTPEQIADSLMDDWANHCDKVGATTFAPYSLSFLRSAIKAGIQAERDAAKELVDALNAARDSIVKQATDIMWVDKAYSPNCTTVDYIDLALAAYLSDREKQESILFLGSVQQYKGQRDEMILIQIIMEHFKFGYGGYNGYFENKSELFDRIEEFLVGVERL